MTTGRRDAVAWAEKNRRYLDTGVVGVGTGVVGVGAGEEEASVDEREYRKRA